ncbi:MAG: type II secretion system protein [Zoogloea sp.]|uniref:type IV pilus modification PilV family protein n=1 Tax=Zoogloea sp. TaxID=49181 RepID=UPI0026124709|nr:type II secretion system protein [Zoogloea sp.]MDD2987853.1 type II secretion system protein [Zoogloea sp.]
MREGRVPLARRQRGVSLIEVLAAFSIMAFSLAVLYSALSTSIRSVRSVERLDRAVGLAERLVTRFDLAPKGGWQESGQQDDGYSWAVVMTLLPSEVDPPVVPLYHLSVRIEWVDGGRNKLFGLDTVVPEKVGLL